MKKINWGTKIALFYSAFVIYILAMVFLASNEKYELVTEDYYQKEIEFQHKIDKTSNAKTLENPVQLSLKADKVEIVFPSSLKDISGMVQFFRPSDEAMDFQLQLKPSSNRQSVALSRLVKGKYLVKIDWVSNQTEYYQESVIIIP